MNPEFQVYHEQGWDLRDEGTYQVLIDKDGNVITSLNHDDIEYLARHGMYYNTYKEQFEIPTHDFIERGFHPEVYTVKN